MTHFIIISLLMSYELLLFKKKYEKIKILRKTDLRKINKKKIDPKSQKIFNRKSCFDFIYFAFLFSFICLFVSSFSFFQLKIFLRLFVYFFLKPRKRG